jgi:hypothetical protein
VETLEEDEVPSHKQGQTLKHVVLNLNDFDIGEYVTEEELHLIVSEGIEVMNDLPPGAEFYYDKFGRYHDAWEEKLYGPDTNMIRSCNNIHIEQINSYNQIILVPPILKHYKLFLLVFVHTNKKPRACYCRRELIIREMLL